MRTPTPRPPEPAARADARTGARPGTRRELWIGCAWAWCGVEVASVLYLGARRAGPWPVRVYTLGPIVLALGALGWIALGGVQSLLRRPFLQPGRAPAFAILAAVIATASYPLPFPAHREGRPSRVLFEIPVQGEWRVVWGGDDTQRNLLARTRADRRFGCDWTVARDGRACAGDGARLEDWYAFGAAVSAPCAGRVVAVVDGIADTPPGARAASGSDLGNHVALEIAPGEILIVSNLRCGSLRVAPGADVVVGAPLGEVGCSGSRRVTRAPHLALHVVDGLDARWSQGIPFRFRAYLENGAPVQHRVPKGRPLESTVGEQDRGEEPLGDRVQALGT